MGSYRLFALDGFSAKAPDTEENLKAFGRPGSSRGQSAYPLVRDVALFDVATRLVAAHRHGGFRDVGELTLAAALIDDVPENACVVLDRGFYGKEFLWGLHRRRNAHFILRLRRNVRPKRVKRLGRGDYLVDLDMRPHTDSGAPRTWRLREIAFRPPGSDIKIRVLTDLLDPLVLSAQAATSLYHDRWESETATREIKVTMGDCSSVSRPTLFRSLTPERVEQELHAFLFTYNLVRALMAESCLSGSSTGHKPGDTAGLLEAGLACPRRLSFKSCLGRVQRTAWDLMKMALPELEQRYEKLMASLRRRPVPKRPGRKYPRRVKVKMSKFELKRPSRASP